MFLKVVLLATFLCGIIEPPGVEGRPRAVGRIFGGRNAVDRNFPWLISINRNGYHWCGGAILNPRFILTAAHCIFTSSTVELAVRVGSKYSTSGGQLHLVEEGLFHAGYNSVSQDYDIALLRVMQEIRFSSSIQPIALPQQGEIPPAGVLATISGWGGTETGNTPFLRYVSVWIIDQNTCLSLYYGYFYSDRMFCAGTLDSGMDICGGDSGSPLVANDKVVGIASFRPGNACGIPHEAGSYARVSEFVDWIIEAIEDFGETL